MSSFSSPIFGLSPDPNTFTFDAVTSIALTGTFFLARNFTQLFEDDHFGQFSAGVSIGVLAYMVNALVYSAIFLIANHCNINDKWQELLNRPISIILTAGIGKIVFDVTLVTALYALSPMIITATATSVIFFFKRIIMIENS